MARYLDLFAGPGGWDEGVRPLGIEPLGIEWDPAACATAEAADHRRLCADVSRLDPATFGPVRGLIASPPCQGFSTAGRGRGRDDSVHMVKALADVGGGWGQLETVLADLHVTMADDRSLLALEPLRWCLELDPCWTAWEQVPVVLPLWEACAAVLRRRGYTVATGLLRAEQYGVPQTRRRAVLVARDGQSSEDAGPAVLPAPTHSRYYERTPDRLDPGVLPWVCMADALGWDRTDRVGFPRRADDREVVCVDGVDYRARDLHPASRPAPTLTEKARSWSRVVMHAAGRTSPDTAGTVPQDPGCAPSATTTGKGTAAWEYVNGTHDHAARRPVDAPAPTVMFGARANTVTWTLDASNNPRRTRPRRTTEPAPAVRASRSTNLTWAPLEAVEARTTRTAAPGAVRVTVAEAAALQTFPPAYPWQGSLTARYRQVGDAVPPLLARAVVAAVAGCPPLHFPDPDGGVE